MLSSPPRDANGRVIPHDDPAILNDDLLIRRINPNHVVDDANLGRKRISTKAIQPSSEPNGGMSVDHERSIRESGNDPAAFVTVPPYTGSIAFAANAARTAKLRVGPDPILPPNPYHCEVWGPDPRPNQFTRSQQKALLRAAAWFVAIPGVSIE
jgi:hypothetical protein